MSDFGVEIKTQRICIFTSSNISTDFPVWHGTMNSYLCFFVFIYGSPWQYAANDLTMQPEDPRRYERHTPHILNEPVKWKKTDDKTNRTL